MTENLLFAPSAEIKSRAFISARTYDRMYARSLADPEAFWKVEADRIDWIKAPTKIKNTTFEYPNVSIKWFEDGVLNIAANCIDRHLPERAEQTAIIWEGDTPVPRTSLPTSNSMTASAASPMCSRTWASRRATGSPSTCR